MQIPNSIAAAGFTDPQHTPRSRIKLKNGQILKPLLIGTEGMTDTGKTEFALSTPGFIQMICVDRNFSGVFDNPHPPESRNPNVALKVIAVPMAGQAKIPEYQEYHKNIRESFYTALAEPNSQVVMMDGDSDWWDIHILAHFGKNTQIYPATRYAAPNSEKKAIIARAWDSGKIVYCTNKVTDEYDIVLDDKGQPKKDGVTGEVLRERTGRKRRQGYKEQDYLYDLQLCHLYQPAGIRKMGTKTFEVPASWGIRILKCKHNMSIIGAELWGEECCFRGLVELCYPDVPLERWGF